jgi:prepilin-type N-terminal cleavage/methylation domain-containing protein
MNRIKSALERRLAEGKKAEGFSLIELLVVVIIIGILAAIAIPIYIGVQNNANDSAAKSDLANAKTAVVAFYTANSAFPSAISSTILKDYGYSGTAVTSAASGTATILSFCLKATGGAGVVFYINQDLPASSTKPGNCA